MKAFLSCDSSIVRIRTPVRLLDANEFLFIATETFHKSSAPFPSNINCDHAIDGTPRASPKNRSVMPLTSDKAQTTFSTGAAIIDDNEEDEAQLQSRLGSLLERVKKRQQVSGL
ncbi:Hypothetical protein PHPALM_10962 [Phytophthora palmivora]|uniref:Uncharacterized protein n=1 Tax=Phytophthora palmivora TaxID=4796 RepID=A0A2P4Y3E6_9STRA|nr:Hypothetical protein PHPALM_10962 [Phytophthora palmivora]